MIAYRWNPLTLTLNPPKGDQDQRLPEAPFRNLDGLVHVQHGLRKAHRRPRIRLQERHGRHPRVTGEHRRRAGA